MNDHTEPLDLDAIEAEYDSLLGSDSEESHLAYEVLPLLIAEVRRLRELVRDYYGVDGLRPDHIPNPSD